MHISEFLTSLFTLLCRKEEGEGKGFKEIGRKEIEEKRKLVGIE